MPHRVILYASCTVDEASSIPSTEAQMIRLRQHARFKGQTVIAEFNEDNQGPALNQALDMLSRGEASMLKVVHMSRVALDTQLFGDLVERLERWGAQMELLDAHLQPLSSKARVLAYALASSNSEPHEPMESATEQAKFIRGASWQDECHFLLEGRIWFAERTHAGPRFDKYLPSTVRSEDGRLRHYYRRSTEVLVSESAVGLLAQLPVEDVEEVMMLQIMQFMHDEFGPDTHSLLVSRSVDRSAAIAREIAAVQAGLEDQRLQQGSGTERSGETASAGALGEKLRSDEESLAEAKLLDLHYLDAWFRRMPAELEVSEQKLRLLESSYGCGARRTSRAMLRDLLCDPFGVIIWPERMELSFKSGAIAGEISQRCTELGRVWGAL